MVVSDETMTRIGKEGFRTEKMIKKLSELSLKREPQDKLLGHYKVGDLAIATLIKLGEKKEEISGLRFLDEFKKRWFSGYLKKLNGKNSCSSG
ncbi:MAG: hypothetical protein ACQEXV_19950 [Bacillota bacterium]